MCPTCSKPLFGSASRGKLGKYYSAYHCNNRGHYFRVNKKEFDKTISDFVGCLKVSPEYLAALLSLVGEAFDKQQLEVNKDAVTIDLRITQLRSQVRQAVDKIKFLSSEATIKYLEELLLHQSNPVLQAKYCGVLFNKAPTYQDIVSGTPDISKLTDLNEIFVPKNFSQILMAGE